MALLNFRKKAGAPAGNAGEIEAFLQGYSIEVMPRTADKVEDFRDLLVRVTGYSAHFTSLGKEIQDDIIARHEHAV